VVVMPVSVVVTRHRLRQILDIRKLAAFGGVAEIRGEFIELSGGCGVSVDDGGLRGAFQVGRDLLRHLLILCRIGLLKLLQLAEHLRKRRERAAILGHSRGRSIDAFSGSGTGIGRAGPLHGRGEDRLKVTGGEVVYRHHGMHIGTFCATTSRRSTD
jgi:hypothetical protein